MKDPLGLKNPIKARALANGMTGDAIPIVLFTGKRIIAIALNEIISPNVVAFFTEKGWYIHGTAVRQKINSRINKFTKNRGVRKIPPNPLVQLNWLLRVIKDGSVECACGHGYFYDASTHVCLHTCSNGTTPTTSSSTCVLDNTNPDATVGLRHVAYFNRGFLDGTPAPYFTSGFPYEAGINGSTPPFYRYFSNAPSASITIDGKSLFPLIPTATGTNAHTVAFGSYDGLNITNPTDTFIHIGAIEGNWLNSEVLTAEETSHLFTGESPKSLGGMPPEFSYPTGETIINDQGDEEAVYGFYGYPATWWYQIDFDILKVGNNVYGIGEDLFLLGEPEEGYTYYTSGSETKASIIGRAYVPVEGEDAPYPPVGGGWNKLWDGYISPPVPPNPPPVSEENYNKISAYYEVGSLATQPTKLLDVHAADSQSFYFASSLDGSRLVVKAGYKPEDVEEISEYSIPGQPIPPQWACKLHKVINGEVTTYSDQSPVDEDLLFWLADVAHEWDLRSAILTNIWFTDFADENIDTGLLGGYNLWECNVIDDSVIVGLNLSPGAFQNQEPVLDEDGNIVPLLTYLKDNPYELSVHTFSVTPDDEFVPPNGINYVYKAYKVVEYNTTTVSVDLTQIIQSLGGKDAVTILACSPIVIS